ncbi:hypothetical protein HG530_011874 [Fusarium avenaceum]|nr:hypothetical protein HG530_011874 [Fusarium avenaceum]
MAPRPFLSLPCELRHHIYKEYFALHGGYVFQPGSGKLADADGQPLDLALMSSCSLIAFETKELPFKYNSITFSTVYHPEWRAWAGRFDCLLNHQIQQRHGLVIYPGRFLTPEITSQIKAIFPWFVPVLEDAVRQFGVNISFEDLRDLPYWGIDMSLGSCPVSFHTDRPSDSALCRAVNFTLRLLAQDPGPGLSQAIDDKLRELEVRGGLSVFLDQHFKPWDIPAMSDLEDCGYRYYDHRIWKNMHHWHIGEKAQYEYRFKFRFSATSVAIRFLKHLPLDKRLFIRNVVIREDRVAVGHPSSHALGLIPFCKENLRLKIDLQVGMLDNIFQRTYLARHYDASCVEAFASHDLGEQAFEAAIGGIFCEVKEWLNEALCLIDAGMPAGSFTLTLDGENAIDLCSDIFQRVVLKELAMQQALERVNPRRPGQLREDWFGSGWRVPTVGIEHLLNQTSFLRSNFHPGIIPNVDKVVARRLDYDEEKWREDLTPSPWYDFSPSVHVPRLGAPAMENFERRTCSRETKAQRRRDRRFGTYREAS